MAQWRKISNGKMMGGFCHKCTAPICPNCTAKFAFEGCIPYIQQLERAHDMTVKLKQHLKIAGLEPEPQRGFFTGIIQSDKG